MANKYLLVLFFFCLTLSTHYTLAQTSQDMIDIAKVQVEEADNIYAFGDKRSAGELYREAAKSDPNNIRAQFMAGMSYLETIRKERALKYLLKAYYLDPNVSPDILFLIAKAYHLGEQFDKASHFYELYRIDVQSKVGTVYNKNKAASITRTVNKKLNECANGKILKSNPIYIKIESVGSNINSADPEYAPAISADESVMIFTGRRSENVNNLKDNDNMFFEEIFMSTKNGDSWGALENINSINTPTHDASIGLSADGKTLLLYKDVNGGDIFISTYGKDKKWSKPKSISNQVNSGYKESSASISPDGQLLFFASDRPGGFGGIDIYVSPKLSGDKWGSPSNLGPNINTEFDDDSPVLDFNGKSLYFSSKGHNGMGEYDLFKSEFDSTTNQWSGPVNLGYPINTPDNDTYYVISSDGKRAYYASVKDDLGDGDLDIFMLTVPENEADSTLAMKQMKKKVTEDEAEIKMLEKLLALNFKEDVQVAQHLPKKEPAKLASTETVPAKDNTKKQTAEVKTPPVAQPISFTVVVKGPDGQPIDATVQLVDATSNLPVDFDNTSTGTYTVQLKDNKQRRYTLSVEKEGYMFKNIPLTIPAASANAQNLTRNITLDRISVGLKSILRNIYFDFDQVTLKSESFAELTKIEKVMRENNSIIVEIAGHTDKVGTSAYNRYLSKQRAEAVVKYLVNKGIPASRFKAVGYGSGKPMASNDDEQEGRELNRRTEFEVLSK
jgi:outer membrane protein OmpA-like peptidoglycan-associated protein